MLPDKRGHRRCFVISFIEQTCNNADLISLGSVLARLPFTFDPKDWHFHADDRAGKLLRKLFRRILNFPGGGLICFMSIRQSA